MKLPEAVWRRKEAAQPEEQSKLEEQSKAEKLSRPERMKLLEKLQQKENEFVILKADQSAKKTQLGRGG